MLLPTRENLANLAATTTQIHSVQHRFRYAVVLAADERGHGWPAADISSICSSVRATTVAEDIHDSILCSQFSPKIDVSSLRAPIEDIYLQQEVKSSLPNYSELNSTLLPIVVFPGPVDAPTVAIGSGIVAWATIPYGDDPVRASVRALKDVHSSVLARTTAVTEIVERRPQLVRSLSLTLAVEFDRTSAIAAPAGWDSKEDLAAALVTLQSRLSEALGMNLTSTSKVRRGVISASGRNSSVMWPVEVEEILTLGLVHCAAMSVGGTNVVANTQERPNIHLLTHSTNGILLCLSQRVLAGLFC